jgi:tetratricopeptide (TPR) repeat protein
MSDQDKASQLAKSGFDLWREGRLEEAVPKYREALESAGPNHDAASQYHGEFGAVLVTLERHHDALEQYGLALTAALRQGPEEGNAEAAVARHFLGEHLVRMNEPAKALAVVEPPERCGTKYEWLLRCTQAEALLQLGQLEEATRVLNTAIEMAPSDQNRNNIRQRLVVILNRSVG